MKSVMVPFVTLVSFFVLIVFGQMSLAEPSASAEAIGGEHSVRGPAGSGMNGVSRKRYPGGADEDDLQVQATLPIPSRTLDGISTVSSPLGEGSEGSAPPPAND